MTGHNPKHRAILFRSKCHIAFSVRYEPGKACQIILACIVLHNIAVKLRLPVPDEDDHPVDDDNDGNDGNNEGGVPTVTGRAKRDRLVQRYFSGYTHFPNHIMLLTYFI